ncbi:MAG: glycosyltransferase family 39 protein [Ardenticatenales bacterium]|nr:glycosyltransferase family 39 protein [Ardenticatenales bacterium]
MTSPSPTPRRDVACGLALIALCAAFFALSTRWFGFYAWGIDEGMYVMRARMMGEGFALYRDIWFNHPPLLVLLVRAMFDARGESVEAARLVPLFCATLGLAATVVIARALGGWRAGFAAGTLLVVSPLWFSLSRAVMATLPALSLAMVSMALIVGYRAATRDGRRAWAIAALVTSGLAFGIGLAVKLIALPWLVPLALLALDGHVGKVEGSGRPTWRTPHAWPWGRIAVDALLWAVAAAAPLAWVVATYGIGAVASQAVGSLVTARAALGFDFSGNVAKLLEAGVEGQLGILALGVFAVAFGLSNRPGGGRDARGVGARHAVPTPTTTAGNHSAVADDGRRLWWIVAVWLIVGLAAVLLHAPIWSHHYLLLVYPLAVAAGCGLWAVVDSVAPAARDDDAGWRAFAFTVAGAVLLSLPVQAVRLVDSTRAWDDAAGEAIARLGDVAKPGDYVITDSPMIAFRAGLNVPPDLCDPGKKRIDAGELTMDAVLADIERFQPSAVLFWEGRLSRGPFGGFPAAVEGAGFVRVAELDARAERWLYGR